MSNQTPSVHASVHLDNPTLGMYQYGDFDTRSLHISVTIYGRIYQGCYIYDHLRFSQLHIRRKWSTFRDKPQQTRLGRVGTTVFLPEDCIREMIVDYRTHTRACQRIWLRSLTFNIGRRCSATYLHHFIGQSHLGHPRPCLYPCALCAVR